MHRCSPGDLALDTMLVLVQWVWGEGFRVCICNKLPVDADETGPSGNTSCRMGFEGEAWTPSLELYKNTNNPEPRIP